jgi:poly-gamma-glutamate synthesis protein (capsule biosynthesis protein)
VQPDKGINCRMHPKNLPCLTAARIDCCVLANNHPLDRGYAGLSETLATLHDGGIRCAGAGEDSTQAQSHRAGVDLLPDVTAGGCTSGTTAGSSSAGRERGVAESEADWC